MEKVDKDGSRYYEIDTATVRKITTITYPTGELIFTDKFTDCLPEGISFEDEEDDEDEGGDALHFLVHGTRVGYRFLGDNSLYIEGTKAGKILADTILKCAKGLPSVAPKPKPAAPAPAPAPASIPIPVPPPAPAPSTSAAKSYPYGFHYTVTPLSDAFKKEQEEFLKSLTPDEQKILTSYTRHGDEIINPVLRESPTRPGLNVRVEQLKKRHPTDNKLGFIPSFVSDFMKIIKRAPTLKEELTLYRGIRAETYRTPNEAEVVSTTYNSQIAEIFGPEKADKCCRITLHVKPGVRVLWLEPITKWSGESEILLIPPFKEVRQPSTTPRDIVVTISPVTKQKGGTTRRGKTRKSKRKSKSTRRR
jgi:hypothetical protein